MADAPALAEYRSDPAVARYQSWAIPFTTADAEALLAGQADLARPTAGEWMQIAVHREDELVGDVAVHLSDDGRHAEVGVTMAREHQGQGYGREAMAALVSLLFRELGVERIEAEIDPRNGASIALFERLGFVHERTAHRAVEVRGEWCDSAWYAVTDGPERP